MWVPSIGSMYQRTDASPASVPYSSPTRPWSGNASSSRSRMRRSIAVSAWVTNVRSGLVVDLEVAPEVLRARSTSASSQAAMGDIEPAAQLGVRPAPERRPTTSVPKAPARSCADPLAGRVPQRLARDLEPDPLAEHLDLAARPDRRASGGR